MISCLTRNSYGFGYIQVLLTSSAIAGLALFGMKLSKEHESVVDKSYRKKLTYFVTQEINHLLRDGKNCTSSLKGYSVKSSYVSHLNSIVDGNRREILSIDQKFFDEQIQVKNIKIYGKREDARLEEGLTFLEIDFSIIESDKIIKRSIPIFFKQGIDNKISTCFSQGAAVFASKDKNWKSLDGHTHAHLPKVELGPIQNLKSTNAAWNNKGAISFTVKKISDLDTCSKNLEGSILFTDIYGPTICKNNNWRRLGTRELSWHLRKDFEVRLNTKGRKELPIDDYESCYMREIKKRNLSEGCLLRKNKGTYTLTAFSSEEISFLSCKVSCVK